MTKPLSEQVAELEAERDRLKADAISDLIKRHWLENQVRNREAERDDLQRQVQEARDEADEAQTEVERLTESRDNWRQFGREHVARANRFHAENANLRAKAEALRAGQGWWPKPPVPSPATYGPDVPKVEVRWSGDRDFPCCSSRSTGCADDDHQDAEITDWHQPTPRLTVPDLKVAPDWSVLHHRERRVYRIKHANYWWLSGEEDMSAPLTSEAAIANGWADATLTTPEAQ